MLRCTAIAVLFCSLSQGFAVISSNDAAFFLDFATSANGVRLVDGARHDTNYHALLFTTASQYPELTEWKSLNGVQAMTIGGWFFPRRSGEQLFLFRGQPE